MNLFCCQCAKDVPARLTCGAEVYPHRKDLAKVPRWICDACGNHVGCHHKTKNRTKPLGCIPNREISNARQFIHALIDPAWKSGAIGRKALYKKISAQLGYQYHTAEIRTIEQAREVYRVSRAIIYEYGAVEAKQMRVVAEK